MLEIEWHWLDNPITTVLMVILAVMTGVRLIKPLGISTAIPKERWKFPQAELWLLAWAMIGVLTSAGIAVFFEL